MDRRTYLTAMCSAGVVTTAGCNALAGEKTLSEPTVDADSKGRKVLVFADNGQEIGYLGVNGRVEPGLVKLSTTIWHRDETTVDSVRLRVWMPETATESPSEVAVISPVEGDSSAPPSITLSTPDRALGSVIEITDFDDLANETISTLDLLVRPGSKTATTLMIQTTIGLTGTGSFSSNYTLTGELELEYPELSRQ